MYLYNMQSEFIQGEHILIRFQSLTFGIAQESAHWSLWIAGHWLTILS